MENQISKAPESRCLAPFFRCLTSVLILSLALPNSAFALRTRNGGLEESTPVTEAIQRALQAEQSTLTHHLFPMMNAGAEEKISPEQWTPGDLVKLKREGKFCVVYQTPMERGEKHIIVRLPGDHAFPPISEMRFSLQEAERYIEFVKKGDPSASPLTYIDDFLDQFLRLATSGIPSSTAGNALEGLDVNSNLEAMLTLIPDRLSLQPHQRQELGRLFDDYLKLERFVHRVGVYPPAHPWAVPLDQALKRLFDLEASGFPPGTLLSTAEQGRDRRGVVSMVSPIDQALRADEYVSTHLGLAEDLFYHRPLFSPTHPDVAAVFILRPEVKTQEHLAFNVQDTADFLLGFDTNQQRLLEASRRTILSVTTLNRLRKELLMKLGPNQGFGTDASEELCLSLYGYLYIAAYDASRLHTVFGPREVMFHQKVLPEFIEAIVVDDATETGRKALELLQPYFYVQVAGKPLRNLLMTRQEFRQRYQDHFNRAFAIREKIHQQIQQFQSEDSAGLEELEVIENVHTVGQAKEFYNSIIRPRVEDPSYHLSTQAQFSTGPLVDTEAIRFLLEEVPVDLPVKVMYGQTPGTTTQARPVIAAIRDIGPIPGEYRKILTLESSGEFPVGEAARTARELYPAAGFDQSQPPQNWEAALARAVDAWRDVVVTPPSMDVAKRLLPIFYAPETFHAIPLVAKGGLPFLVIVSSDEEEASVRMLLGQLEGVSSSQYEIRQVPDGKQAAKEAMENLTHYATYLVDPHDPTRPDWLQELLKRLREEGVFPLGPYQPALQATELYFQTLA